MAEGDSIRRLAGRFERELAGHRVAVRAPGPRRPAGLPCSAIDGRTLMRAESRGKHLILHFAGGLALHSHLGMRGSWHLYGADEPWRRPASQAWIALSTERASAVNFGGSRLRIAREAELRRDPRLAHLGPDLLAEDFHPSSAIARIHGAGGETELGEALLDQSLVAGIGNIFKSEGCFAAMVDPRTPVRELSDEELDAVFRSTRELMLAALRSGRQPGLVYRRAHRPCRRCGTRIRSAAQGDAARVSYWCPRCQSRG